MRYRYLLVEGQPARRHGLERTSENGKLDDACRHTSRVRRHSDFAIERRKRLRIKRHSIDRGRPTIRLGKGFDILLKAGNPRSPGDSVCLLSGRMIRLLLGRDSGALSPTLLAAVHRLTPHHRILPSRR